LLNNQWIIEEIREETKKFLDFNEMETQPTRNYGTQQKQSKEESL
jgi:hypothetical protein